MATVCREDHKVKYLFGLAQTLWKRLPDDSRTREDRYWGHRSPRGGPQGLSVAFVRARGLVRTLGSGVRWASRSRTPEREPS